MNTELERRKQEISATQSRRKLWQRVVSGLAAVVMFVTTYVLILPVQAKNKVYCGHEAHTHSISDGCYLSTKTLICTEEEGEGHTHTDTCYNTHLTLICPLEEHQHNKECYSDKTADVETQLVWEDSISGAETTGEWANDLLKVANTQLGYKESSKNYTLGENNEIKGYTRYGDWIGERYVDWSAAFAAFCINYAGINRESLPYDKDPAEWSNLLIERDLYKENLEALEAGDIVFVDENDDRIPDRVAIAVEIEPADEKEITNELFTIKTLEGDRNNEVAFAQYSVLSDELNANKQKNSATEATTPDILNVFAKQAEIKPVVVGFTSIPKNPDYVPQINTTDPTDSAEPGEIDDREIKATEAPISEITLSAETENGIKVTLVADSDAFDFDASELTLSVSHIDNEKAAKLIRDAADRKTDDNENRTTVLFDIKVMHDGEELQPKKPVRVTISGVSTPYGDAQVFHVDTESNIAEDMHADRSGSEFSFDAPHFSFYGITYRSAAIPTLMGTPTGKVVLQHDGVEENYPNLADAMRAIGSGTSEYTVIFIEDFPVAPKGAQTIAENGGNASKITFTSTYIEDGTQKGPFLVTIDANPLYSGASEMGVYMTSDTTELHNIRLLSASNRKLSFFARGHKLTFGENVKTEGDTKPCIYGGDNNYYCEGNAVITVLSGDWDEITAANHGGNLYKGTSKVIFAGTASASAINSSCTKGGKTESARIDIDVDGTDGAVIRRHISANDLGCTMAGDVALTLKLKNIHDIEAIDYYNAYGNNGFITGNQGHKLKYDTSLGCKITIEGNVHISNYLYSAHGIDIEIAEGAVLKTGGSFDETQQPQPATSWADSAFKNSGRIECEGYFIMNASSKLLLGPGMPGDAKPHALGNLKVNGSGAEIGIFKHSDRTSFGYCYSFEGTPVKLNIIKGSNAEPLNMSDVLLRYEPADEAVEEEYIPGSIYQGGSELKEIEHLTKDAANIIPCVQLEDYYKELYGSNTRDEDGNLKLDVGIGRIVFDKDDYNGQGSVRQYHHFTNKLLAHTHGLEASYTLYGDSTTPYVTSTGTGYSRVITLVDANVPGGQPRVVVAQNNKMAKVKVTEGTTVELVLDGITMYGDTYACFDVSYANTTLTLKNNKTNELNSSTEIRKASNGGSGMPNGYCGGCLCKNGMTGMLTIRCQHMKAHPHDTEHECGPDCGVLICDASGAEHNPAIGARLFISDFKPGPDLYLLHDSNNIRLGDQGLSNLYINGGHLTVRAGTHNAAIGCNCFIFVGTERTPNAITIQNASLDTNGRPKTDGDGNIIVSEGSNKLFTGVGGPVSRGQMTKNINIAHAVVKAYGGECAPAIGAGYGAMVDGIYIKDGAHVLAQGGYHSPGIGTGSADTFPHPTQNQYTFHARNIFVSGGSTVVEAIGGPGMSVPGLQGQTLVMPDNGQDPHLFMPGVGVGGTTATHNGNGYTYTYEERCQAGTMINTFAVPDSGYVAIIKQTEPAGMTDENGLIDFGGLDDDLLDDILNNARESAEFVEKAPSSVPLEINEAGLKQPYVQIYFSKLEKVAIFDVDGDEVEKSGSAENPVQVAEEEEFTYKLTAGKIVENGGVVTATIEDILPYGLTLIEESELPKAGFHSEQVTVDGEARTKIVWEGATLNADLDFSVKVKVDLLPNGINYRDFVNQATLSYEDSSGAELTLVSNKTYHFVQKIGDVSFVKVTTNADDEVIPLAGTRFALYECCNTSPEHDHTLGDCEWEMPDPETGDPLSPIATCTSGNNGVISFDDLDASKTYVIVEEAHPQTVLPPTAGLKNYILLQFDDRKPVITGFGYFEGNVLNLTGSNGEELFDGVVTVKNEPKRYTLTINKHVIGGDLNNTFPFDVTFLNPNTMRTYVPKPEHVKVYKSGVDMGTGAFIILPGDRVTARLGHDYQMVITDIPYGFYAYIAEKAYAPYNITITGDAQAAPRDPATTDRIVMDANKEVTFSNELNAVSLKVEKVVVNGEGDEEFPFTIQIKDKDDNIFKYPLSYLHVYDADDKEITGQLIDPTGSSNPPPISEPEETSAPELPPTGSGSLITWDEHGIQLPLRNGHHVILDHVPAGYIVTVSEDLSEEPCKLFEPTISEDGKASANDPTMTEPITMNSDKFVRFTNTLKTVQVKIQKTVQGAITETAFPFRVEISAPGNLAVKLYDSYNNNEEIVDRIVTVNGTVATFELEGGDYAIISGILIGSEITVKEITHDGYTVLIKNTTAGGNTIENGDTATITVDTDLELEVINNAGYELPDAGGRGTLIYTLSGALICATALMYGMACRNKRRRRDFEA